MSWIVRAIEYARRDSPREIFRKERKKVWNLIPFGLRLRYRVWKHSRNHPRDAIADPLKIIHVDPFEINDGERFNRVMNIGEIKDGDWDLARNPITEHPTYQGLHSRFVEGKAWEDTEYWSLAVDKMEQDGQVFGYNSLERFKAHRLPYVDNLYRAIAEDGYRTQKELDPSDRDEKRHRRNPKRHRVTHEVGINIARDGTLLLNSGFHRLSIARILELDQIPVLVIVRHGRWQQKRNEICVSQQIDDTNHPDLSDIKDQNDNNLSS